MNIMPLNSASPTHLVEPLAQTITPYLQRTILAPDQFAMAATTLTSRSPWQSSPPNNARQFSTTALDSTLHRPVRLIEETPKQRQKSNPWLSTSTLYLINSETSSELLTDSIVPGSRLLLSTDSSTQILSDIYSSVPFILDSYNEASQTVTEESGKSLRKIFDKHPVHKVVTFLGNGMIEGMKLAISKGTGAMTGGGLSLEAGLTASLFTVMGASFFESLQQNIDMAADTITAHFVGLKPADIPLFMEAVSAEFKQALRNTLFTLREINDADQLLLIRDVFDSMTRDLGDLKLGFMQGLIQSVLDLGQEAVVNTPFGIYSDVGFTPLIAVSKVEDNGRLHRVVGIKLPELVAHSPKLKEAYLAMPGALTHTVNVGIFYNDLAIIVKNGEVISWSNFYLTLDDSPASIMKKKGARTVKEALQMIVDTTFNVIGNIDSPIAELGMAELM